MRLISFIICLVLLTISLVGCGSDETAVGNTGLTSFKGWELYSWQEDGQWSFSLLEGTNREKNVDEVRSPDAVLDGVDALQTALERLAAGQYVTWWSPSWLSATSAFPPDDIVEQVQLICKERGLELAIAR